MRRALFAALLALTPIAAPAQPQPAPSAATADQLKAAQRAGRIANAGGRFDEAEAAFRTALELQTGPLQAGGSQVAATLLDLGLNVSNQGRFDEAEALFRRADPLLQAADDPALRARLSTYLAMNAAARGTYPVALTYARDAVERWARLVSSESAVAIAATDAGMAASRKGEYANALTLQARLELRQENLLAAYGAASQALLILNQTNRAPRWWKADALLALGEVSIAQGRLSAAETYFDAALTIRRQLFGNGVPTIKVLLALGQAYQREGLSTSAIVTYREVFRLARALPSSAGVFTADMLVPFAAAVSSVAATLDDPVKRAGLYAEAFDAFQLVQSPLVDRTIAQAAARQSAATPAIAALIDQVQDRQRIVDQGRLKLAYEESLPDGERNAVEEARLRAQLAADTATVATARTALERQYPDYATLVAPQTLQLDAFRALLQPGEGVLSFLIGREQSFAQLVTRDGAVIAPVAEGADGLRDAVATLRRPLVAQGGSIGEFDLTEAHRLHDVLLGKLGPSLTKVQRLIVVPAGPLSNLPFGLLVAQAPAGRDYARADWLIRTRTVGYTPSLPALSRLRTTRRAVAPTRPLLAFGDPVLTGARRDAVAVQQLTGNCRQGGPMPAGLLRALAPLPDTARELDAVAQTLEGDRTGVFLGPQANEAVLRAQALGDYRVLYFATHGLLPGELRCQAEPGLVLTPPTAAATTRAGDGLLETSEIAALRINADVVVLSACDTAAGGGRMGGGDALTGLAEAFFHAGARNLVVSHWQVSSSATTALMTGMFRTWRGGAVGLGSALRTSQLALIADPRTAHPFFWAAFVPVGDGQDGTAGDAKRVASR